MGSKSTYVVKPNEIFTIQLYANPSTGYYWHVEEITNPSAFTYIGRKRVNEDDNERGICGKGGDYIFSFQAGSIPNQQSKFTMIHKRGEDEILEKRGYFVKVTS